VTPKTRPAGFDWTSNFNADGIRERVYRIIEPGSAYVLDASGGQNPGRDRSRVWATVVDEWVGPSPLIGSTKWVVWTKGYSNHGNASTRRSFETLDEAERHIKRWATRRWRVAVEGGAK